MILFAACALTVAVEVALFALAGYREPRQLAVVALANVVTNLTLNLVMWYVVGQANWWLAVLEAAAVAAEFAIYGRTFGPDAARPKLIAWTLAANALSFCVGLPVFGVPWA